MKRLNVLLVMLMVPFALLLFVQAVIASDVVVLYDTSGSVRAHPGMDQMISDVNAAVNDLIWKGRIIQADKWTISEFPSKDTVLPADDKMIEPNSKDILVIHEFDTPDRCEKPFFEKGNGTIKLYRGIPADMRINDYLPKDKNRFRGQFSFIRLARWSAANIISGNSKHPKEPFYLILISDLKEDAGGDCAGMDIIARKIAGFETFYLNDMVYAALYKKNPKDKTNYFTIQVSLVTYKEKPEAPNREDNPIEHAPLPLDPEPFDPLPEPGSLLEPEPLPIDDLEYNGHPESNPWKWIAGIIAVVIVLGGGFYTWVQMQKAKDRNW